MDRQGREKVRSYHFNFDQGLIAVVEKVTCFAAINTDHAEEKLPAKAESKGCIIGSDDGVDAILQVVLQNLDLGNLAFLVGGEPRLGQGAGGTQECPGPEHSDAGSKGSKMRELTMS